MAEKRPSLSVKVENHQKPPTSKSPGTPSGGRRRSGIIKLGVNRASVSGGQATSAQRSPSRSPSRSPKSEANAANSKPSRVINAPRAQIARAKSDRANWEMSRTAMVQWLGDAAHNTLELEAKLEAVFDTYDKESTGRIGEHELMCDHRASAKPCLGLTDPTSTACRSALREMGLDLPRAEVKQLIDEVGISAPASGTIDLSEVCSAKATDRQYTVP